MSNKNCPCCENGMIVGENKKVPAIIGPFTVHLPGDITRRVEKGECFCSCHLNTPNFMESLEIIDKALENE